jgi:hypothetical protein
MKRRLRGPHAEDLTSAGIVGYQTRIPFFDKLFSRKTVTSITVLNRPDWLGFDLRQRLEQHVERLARMEHDRWVAEKRRQGWIAAPTQDRSSRNDVLRLHNYLFPWFQLSDETKDLDRKPARDLPKHLGAAGYEIVEL